MQMPMRMPTVQATDGLGRWNEVSRKCSLVCSKNNRGAGRGVVASAGVRVSLGLSLSLSLSSMRVRMSAVYQ